MRKRSSKKKTEKTEPETEVSALHAFYWDLPSPWEKKSSAKGEPAADPPLSESQQDEVLIFGEPLRSSILEGLGLEFDDRQFFEDMIRPPGPRGPEYFQGLEAQRLMFELICNFKPPLRDEVIQQPPYRDFRVVEALLAESERCMKKSSPLSTHAWTTAQLAEQIARLLVPEHPSRAWATQAHAHSLQGCLERLRGHWDWAEAQFRSAWSLLVLLVKDATHAAFYQELAALREDQGRLVEAAALLREAVPLFRQWGQGERANNCLIRLGFVYLQQNDPGRAMEVLAVVHERIPSLLVYPLAQVKLGQAMCLAAVGLTDLARQVKASSLRLRKSLKTQERVKMEWLECRIAVHLGELDTAIPRLEALRRWYLDDKDLGRLCLCTIDLAHAYARTGQLLEQFPDLLAGVAQHPRAGGAVWALEAVWRFREAIVDEGIDPATAARQAAALVQRQIALPSYDPDVEAGLAVADRAAKKHRNALRELAK